ncbi:hypothetical protein ACFWMS_26355 [Peribacillus butanolivorans]|uniref:hypothetical protein n=1 Tax=Peribacillus butanolivorans TaxID=421767 RepID=UPI003650D47C
MAVEVDDTLFPDIHDVLMAYLAPLGETDTDPPQEVGGWLGIQINRVGGHDDGFSDYPRVMITCHAPSPQEASKLARQVRNWMDRIIDADIDVDGEPKPISVDECHVDTPPEAEPYENPDARREVAYYALSLQKPWRI